VIAVISVLAACGARPDAGLLVRLDADHALGPDDAPADLVAVPKRLRVRLERVRAIALGPLARMLDDARDDGVALWVASGFRSFARQRELHAEGDPREVAPPGQSEHQLGTAVDLATGPTTVLDGGEAYAWMDAHAWRHGWINSYPPQDDPSDDRTLRVTGIEAEPWHWRYVGVEAAARAHAVREATGARVSAAELIELLRGDTVRP